MEITTENVTPKKASAWLNKNNNNRNLRDGVAERYAADMRDGNWTECTAPIVFYEDGDLADGQHRLFAVCESDTVQRFIIARGLDRAAGLNIDTGAMRSLVDAAHISGKDPELSATLVSAARAIAEGKASTGSKSNAQKLKPVAAFREPAQFAATHAPRMKYIGSAPILGAIGRAYMHESDKERLKRFCAVLRNGFMETETEAAAIALRNYLQTKGTTASVTANWTDTFLKAQNAIYYFMRGKPLHFIKVVTQEAYPLAQAGAKPLRGLRPSAALRSEQRAAA